MSNEISVGIYVDNFRATGSTAPGLAVQLETAAPSDMTADERRTLAAVLAAGREVAAVSRARARSAPIVKRPQLLALVSAWTGAGEIVSGKARVHAAISEIGAQARELQVRVFFDGVPVSQSTALEAWTASTQMLKLIEEEGLSKSFEAVVGKEVVAHIKQTTLELGEVIGAGETKMAATSSTALLDALAKFGRAVGRYCRMLAAHLDEEDPQSVQRFLDAVLPIDQFRAAQRAGGGHGAEDDVGDEDTTVTSATGGAPAHPVDGAAKDAHEGEGTHGVAHA